MNLIAIYAGSFGGDILYKNPKFVSPNALRRMNKIPKKSFAEKNETKLKQKEDKIKFAPHPDILDDVFRQQSDELGMGGIDEVDFENLNELYLMKKKSIHYFSSFCCESL